MHALHLDFKNLVRFLFLLFHLLRLKPCLQPRRFYSYSVWNGLNWQTIEDDDPNMTFSYQMLFRLDFSADSFCLEVSWPSNVASFSSCSVALKTSSENLDTERWDQNQNLQDFFNLRFNARYVCQTISFLLLQSLKKIKRQDRKGQEVIISSVTFWMSIYISSFSCILRQ